MFDLSFGVIIVVASLFCFPLQSKKIGDDIGLISLAKVKIKYLYFQNLAAS